MVRKKLARSDMGSLMADIRTMFGDRLMIGHSERRATKKKRRGR